MRLSKKVMKHVVVILMVNELFKEWNGLIKELSDKEIDYHNKKEEYKALSQEVIETTDFKALYGRNNESIRKQHVRDELRAYYEDIKDLEFSMNYIERQISYLKELIHYKVVLIECESGDGNGNEDI